MIQVNHNSLYFDWQVICFVNATALANLKRASENDVYLSSILTYLFYNFVDISWSSPYSIFSKKIKILAHAEPYPCGALINVTKPNLN